VVEVWKGKGAKIRIELGRGRGRKGRNSLVMVDDIKD
jgi:hypothetical protein